MSRPHNKRRSELAGGELSPRRTRSSKKESTNSEAHRSRSSNKHSIKKESGKNRASSGNGAKGESLFIHQDPNKPAIDFSLSHPLPATGSQQQASASVVPPARSDSANDNDDSLSSQSSDSGSSSSSSSTSSRPSRSSEKKVDSKSRKFKFMGWNKRWVQLALLASIHEWVGAGGHGARLFRPALDNKKEQWQQIADILVSWSDKEHSIKKELGASMMTGEKVAAAFKKIFNNTLHSSFAAKYQYFELEALKLAEKLHGVGTPASSELLASQREHVQYSLKPKLAPLFVTDGKLSSAFQSIFDKACSVTHRSNSKELTSFTSDTDPNYVHENDIVLALSKIDNAQKDAVARAEDEPEEIEHRRTRKNRSSSSSSVGSSVSSKSDSVHEEIRAAVRTMQSSAPQFYDDCKGEVKNWLTHIQLPVKYLPLFAGKSLVDVWAMNSKRVEELLDGVDAKDARNRWRDAMTLKYLRNDYQR
jgi:hypothetical protein